MLAFENQIEHASVFQEICDISCMSSLCHCLSLPLASFFQWVADVFGSVGRSCRLGPISICCTDSSTVSPQSLWDTLLSCQTLSLIYNFVLSKTLLLSSFSALFRPDISPSFCCQFNLLEIAGTANLSTSR